MTEDGYALIVQLRQAGLSYRQIQARLHIGCVTIKDALRAAGMPTTAIQPDTTAREQRDMQVRAVGEMLADILPEGARVTAKNPSMTTEEALSAECPYARIMIWLDPTSYDCIDGATFCAMHCDSGACETEPSRIREEAFRRYVAKRVREAGVIARQDTEVARRRYLMEKARETFMSEVNTREMEKAR